MMILAETQAAMLRSNRPGIGQPRDESRKPRLIARSQRGFFMRLLPCRAGFFGIAPAQSVAFNCF
jgi:hypothetical protein